MIFFLGIGFLIAAIAMLVMLFISMGRPKIDAQVLEVTMEYYSPNEFTPTVRKFPHGRVDYYDNGNKVETKVLLKGKNVKAGDNIKITVDPKNPKKAVQYSPTKEILIIVLLFVLGAGLMLPGILLNA